MRARTVQLVAALWLMSTGAEAQALVRARIANDTFMGLDRWESSRLELDAVGALSHRLGLSLRGALGQVMFTPRNIQFTEAPERDHAFGAWLYADLGLIAERARGMVVHRAALELRAGVVGPAAGAEAVQDRTHQLLGVRRPRGWDNQLANRFAYILRATYAPQVVIPVDGLDLVFTSGARIDIGNAYRRLRAGLGVALAYGFRSGGGAFFDPALQTAPTRSGRALAFWATASLDRVWHDLFVQAVGAAQRPAIEARRVVPSLRGGWIYRRTRFWLAVLFHVQRRTFDNVPARRLHPRTHQYLVLELGASLGSLSAR